MTNAILAQDYAAFLSSKRPAARQRGLAAVPRLASHLSGDFAFQGAVVDFALRAGSCGVYLDTGLGKSAIELEYCCHAAEVTNGRALILTPLAVARQLQREAERWGYESRVVRSQAEVGPGINICNYDRLHLLDLGAFGAVALDESGILKSFTGSTSRALRAAFAGYHFRLAASATPAPNDHMEIGQQCEFLGVMESREMLMRFFTSDQTQMGRYRLKGHAEEAYYDWLASWSRLAGHPRDLGFDAPGFDLPAMRVVRHRAEGAEVVAPKGSLFAVGPLAATEVHDVKRQTADARAATVAEVVGAELGEAWVVWCDTDYEADALLRALRPLGAAVREVRGSQSIEEKENGLDAFSSGEVRVLMTKPRIAGHGLNWQHCARQVFAGRSHSYEAWYQAVRRSWRFGQRREVVVHLAVAEGEEQIGRVIDRKAEDHGRMKAAMARAMARDRGRSETVKADYDPQHRAVWAITDGTLPNVYCLNSAAGQRFQAFRGDCVDVLRQLPPGVIDLSVFSPPFSSLYIYSDSVADMGNSDDDRQFLEHYAYLARELHRLTRPGRLAVVHCKDLVYYQNQRGSAGLRDFPGDLIRAHQAAGWDFHSRVTVWRSPVREMTKTKAHGLLYKQLRSDSSFSRQGLPEYLLVFRRWPKTEAEEAQVRAVEHSREDFPLDRWQEWASPVWPDTRETDVLQAGPKAPGDEKHICPLPLDLIERAVHLWSSPGDLVLDPFAGIGSVGVVALRCGRRFAGVELKESYWRQAVEHLDGIDRQASIFAAAK